MHPDTLWARGRLGRSLLLGLPAGLTYGGLQFAGGGYSAGRAILGGIFFGLILCVAMSVVMGRRWPAAKDLAPADRVVVVRAVRRGEKVQEARLAGAVIEYAAVVVRGHGRERELQWVLWLFAAGTLALAAVATLDGATRSAIVWWLCVGFWAALLAWIPRRRTRVLTHARQAEAAARTLTTEA